METSNDQYEAIEYCCDAVSGATQTIEFPHPVYTDADGTEYEQLSAVTLGGVNGLNN